MRTSIVTPGGDPPSIGNGIVRPDGPGVNDGGLSREVAGAEEQPPAAAAGRQRASPHQAWEVVLGVAGAIAGLIEGEHLVILGGNDSVEVGEHLAAQLGAVHVGAESAKLGLAGPPADDELLASHGWIPRSVEGTKKGALLVGFLVMLYRGPSR